MKNIEDKIREEAGKLIEDGKVRVVIGYGKGLTPHASQPVFIEKPEDVKQLIWDPFCSGNLAVYVHKLLRPQLRASGKEAPSTITVGVVLKGCDSRSLLMLIKENQIPRENAVIIGVPCKGMIDRRKLERATGERDIRAVESRGEELRVTLDNDEILVLNRKDFLRDDCRTCRYPTPVLYDILLDDPVEASGEGLFEDVREMEGKSQEERWELFVKEMEKCTRCYACRNACPLCYCEECFAEQTRPSWIGVTDDLSDVIFFQIGRIFHTAGRCVDCGACEDACPNGVRLRLFTKKLVKDTEELFSYTAGLSLEDDLPLATFKLDDPDDFVK